MCVCVVCVLYNVYSLGWWGDASPPIPPGSVLDHNTFIHSLYTCVTLLAYNSRFLFSTSLPLSPSVYLALSLCVCLCVSPFSPFLSSSHLSSENHRSIFQYLNTHLSSQLPESSRNKPEVYRSSRNQPTTLCRRQDPTSFPDSPQSWEWTRGDWNKFHQQTTTPWNGAIGGALIPSFDCVLVA